MVERWRRVEELFHAALERDPSERRAFLEQVCGGDGELLSDVSSLLARESGFDLPPDPEIRSKLDELGYLERSIGKTGKLAIMPFLHKSDRDLWQLNMLAGTE